jgi:Flp pilus assembly protein TadG
MFNRSENSQNRGIVAYSSCAKSIFRGTGRRTAAASEPSWLRGSRLSRGQSMVEFALGATLALAVMLIGIQFALIGQSALAVSQSAEALARYAAQHPGALGGTTPQYNGKVTMPLPAAAQNLLPSSITTTTTATVNGKSVTTYDLTVNVATYSGSTTNTTNTPVQFDKVVVSLSYNAANRIVLPSTTLLGISFPSTLAASEAQMY